MAAGVGKQLGSEAWLASFSLYCRTTHFAKTYTDERWTKLNFMSFYLCLPIKISFLREAAIRPVTLFTGLQDKASSRGLPEDDHGCNKDENSHCNERDSPVQAVSQKPAHW